ncbi:MAG: YfhO family protein [Fibrobacteria bacterium]|nr:YfhO family protein [Fibrobacteria bacterium]
MLNKFKKLSNPYLFSILAIGLLPFFAYLFSSECLYASDQIGAQAWNFYFDALKKFEIPLWNPLSLSGRPTFDSMFGDASYPSFILLGLIFPAEVVIGHNFVLHVIIAGFTAFFLARRFFLLDKLPALVIAVCYMLNTNFISHIYAGHTGKFHIMAWLPLALYFLLKCLQKDTKWFHLLGFCLMITLFILTSHLQFTYYCLIGFSLIYGFKLYLQIKEKAYKSALGLNVKFWIPILLGIGLSFPIFYPPIQFNKTASVRGEAKKQTYEHATSWSIHPEETASLLVSEFSGINENYWGRNAFKLNSEYPGLVIAFLSLFGIIAFRKRWMWFWLSVGGLALIFALGDNTFLFHIFYNFVPGIKNFRAPSMMTFWLVMAQLMISAQTLVILFKSPEEENKEKLLKWSAIVLKAGLGVASLFLVLGIFPDMAYSIWNSIFDSSQFPNFKNQVDNYGAFQLGVIRSAVLVAVLTFGTSKWALKSRQIVKFSLLLLAVSLIDLYSVNSNFIKTYPVSRYFPKEPVIDYLKKDTSTYRVFCLPKAFPRSYAQYEKIATVDGFADNEYRVYRNYRGEPYQANPNFMAGLAQNSDGTVSGSKFLDMLNVKYLAYRVPQHPNTQIARNKSVMPRAYFITDWQLEADSLILEKMKASAFNPRQMVFISNQHQSLATQRPPSPDAENQAQITRDLAKNNQLEYIVKCENEGIFVLSEIYFPHWHVTDNGKPSEVLRVNYAFRGVHLLPGEHKLVFVYRSPWLRLGLQISLLAMILLAAFLIGYYKYFQKTPSTSSEITAS